MCPGRGRAEGGGPVPHPHRKHVGRENDGRHICRGSRPHPAPTPRPPARLGHIRVVCEWRQGGAGVLSGSLEQFWRQPGADSAMVEGDRTKTEGGAAKVRPEWEEGASTENEGLFIRVVLCKWRNLMVTWTAWNTVCGTSKRSTYANLYQNIIVYAGYTNL